MPREIEISDEVAEILNEIGGTFDTVDDVLRDVLEEAGYSIDNDTWEDHELRDYFDRTNSSKQKIFVTELVENGDDWTPKSTILDRITDELGDDSVDTHTLDGVQSSMTRRCRSADREKFWERTRDGGEWNYRIKAPYRDVAEDYWA